MNLIFIESNTTGSGMLAFEKAGLLGFNPVLATADPARYSGLAETGVRMVTCDTNAATGLAATLSATIGGIGGITTTSDFYVTTVARVAADLGLPGNAPDAVAACRNKGRMRELLAAARLPSPAFELIEPGCDLEKRVLGALAKIALPCVVKPVDDTGSFGVVLCSDSAEVVAHCRTVLSATTNVRGQRTAATALIEGYLDGPEFSLEMLSSGRSHQCVGIVAKRVTPPPNFVECGHVFPAELPEDTVRLLTRTASSALTTVGITCGVTHVEMKLIDGHGYVVEINARPAGGMIPQVISRGCGFDIIEAHLRAAVGLAPLPLPERFTPAGIAFLLASPDFPLEPEALLQDVSGVAEAMAVPGVDSVTITAPRGSAVRLPRSSYDRLGYVIARASSHAELDETLAAALGRLRPVLLSQPMGIL